MADAVNSIHLSAQGMQVHESQTCADFQVCLKALWRDCIWQDHIFEPIAELALHQAAVLLQLCVQQLVNVWCSCLLHLLVDSLCELPLPANGKPGKHPCGTAA